MRNCGTQSVHQRDKAREAGINRGAVIDPDRPLRGKPQHQEGHGNAMIEFDGNLGTAGGLCPFAAAHRQAVLTFGDIDTTGQKTLGHGAETVALLDPQLSQPQHPRLAFGEGRGDAEDGIFVDHRGRPAGRHRDPLQFAGANPQIADWLASFLAAIEDLDIG